MGHGHIWQLHLTYLLGLRKVVQTLEILLVCPPKARQPAKIASPGWGQLSNSHGHIFLAYAKLLKLPRLFF